MNKTLAIFLSAAALALAALWARNHEDEAVEPPPAPAPVVSRWTPVNYEAPPVPEPAPEKAEVPSPMNAVLELSSGDDDSTELVVSVIEWPSATKLWAWTMPYSNGPDCDTSTLVFDESQAVILGEVTSDEQRFGVASAGALHGVVIGDDADDALARVKALLESPVEVSAGLEVPGVLYLLQGAEPECEEPGC